MNLKSQHNIYNKHLINWFKKGIKMLIEHVIKSVVGALSIFILSALSYFYSHHPYINFFIPLVVAFIFFIFLLNSYSITEGLEDELIKANNEIAQLNEKNEKLNEELNIYKLLPKLSPIKQFKKDRPSYFFHWGVWWDMDNNTPYCSDKNCLHSLDFQSHWYVNYPQTECDNCGRLIELNPNYIMDADEIITFQDIVEDTQKKFHTHKLRNKSYQSFKETTQS